MVTHFFNLFFKIFFKSLIISLLFLSFFQKSFSQDSISIIETLNKGLEKYDEGDYENALQILIQVEQEKDRLSKDDKFRLYSNLGFIYYHIDDYKKAIIYLKKVEKDLSSPLKRVKTLNHLVLSYANVAKFDSAELYLQKSLNTCVTKENYCASYITHAYYYIYFENNMQKGNKYVNKAEELFDSLQEENEVMAYYANFIGNVKRYLRDYKLALNYFQQALQFSANKFNYEDNLSLNEITNEIYFAYALELKAATLIDLYNYENDSVLFLEKSLENYLLAINLYEKMLNNYQNTGSRLFHVGDKRRLFDGALIAIKLLYENTNDRKYLRMGFELSERAKSAVLKIQMQEIQALRLASIPDSIEEEDIRISKEIAFCKQHLYKGNKAIELDEIEEQKLNNRLFKLTISHDSLTHVLERQYPQYYNFKYNQSVISTNDIKKRLAKDEALLEYIVRDSAVVIFAITKDTFNVVLVKIDSSFEHNLTLYTENISTYSSSFKKYTDFISSAYYLYSTLIHPVESIIENKRLIIVPDYKISNIPFEAFLLSDSIPEITSYTCLPYLINKYPVSYRISATLAFREIVNDKREMKLLAIAPQFFDVENNADINSALVEATEISKISGGNILKKYNASEFNFKSVYPNYDIIHFSTHSYSNYKDPLFSNIAFAKDSIEDGFLYANEIYNMDFTGKEIVLSSCNSGDGVIAKGEGMLSLARAFILTGSTSIIFTLWEVRDDAGIQLMLNYYKYLYKSHVKDYSLQQSKLEFIKTQMPENAHPYFWANYVCYGNTNKIVAEKEKNYWLLLIPIMIIVFFGAFNLKKSKIRYSDKSQM